MDEVKNDASTNLIVAKIILCLIIVSGVLLAKHYRENEYNLVSLWYNDAMFYQSIDINNKKEKIYDFLALSSESFKTWTVNILRSVTS